MKLVRGSGIKASTRMPKVKIPNQKFLDDQMKRLGCRKNIQGDWYHPTMNNFDHGMCGQNFGQMTGNPFDY